MSDDAQHYDYLMSISAKRFLFELLIFVERVEKKRNERDRQNVS
jgi:hypothetical protein